MFHHGIQCWSGIQRMRRFNWRMVTCTAGHPRFFLNFLASELCVCSELVTVRLKPCFNHAPVKLPCVLLLCFYCAPAKLPCKQDPTSTRCCQLQDDDPVKPRQIVNTLIRHERLPRLSPLKQRWPQLMLGKAKTTTVIAVDGIPEITLFKDLKILRNQN